MDLKPGYKQTAVGAIPKDWDVVQIAQVAEEITVGFVGSMAHLFIKQGVPLLRGQNVLPNKLDLKETRFISANTHKVWKKSALHRGDVVVVRVGYPGTACVIPKELGEANAASLVVIRPLSKKLDSMYLSLVINSDFGKRQIDSYLVGGAQQVLNTTTAAVFKLPLPTKSEQRAIAEALSDVDALIAALDRLIAKKRDIKQATMQELLTGKRRLPDFESRKGYKQTEVGMIPEDWSVVALENAVVSGGLVRGPFGGALKKDCFVKGGYKVYEQRNAIDATVEKGNYFIDLIKFRELERFRIKPGDFIVSCSGTIGCIYQIPSEAPDGVINQALLKISLNDEIVNDRFFLAVFRSKSFQERIKDNTHGGAMQNLVGMTVFKKTRFQLPPRAEQLSISIVLSDMDAEIAALEARREKILALKQGMMQELLTGRIRLV